MMRYPYLRTRLWFLFTQTDLIFLICHLCSSWASGGDQPGPPEKIFITFAEGMTVGPNDKGIQTGYRMWTVPDLKEMRNKIKVKSLEVCPEKIELDVGEMYSLKNLRVIARDANGQIVEHVPISLSYSQWVSCYDDCDQGWEEVEPKIIVIENSNETADLIRGLRQGKIELRLQSLSGQDGTCPLIYVPLSVH